MKPAATRMGKRGEARARLRPLVRALLLGVPLLLGSTIGCAPVAEEGDDESSALRAIEAQDINMVLVEDVPVDAPPSDAVAPAMKRVASWTLRHVEYRDKNDATKPDAAEPFKGYFLIANDRNGEALFLDAISIVDAKEGIHGTVHSFFSFATRPGEKGTFEYEELPLARSDDPAAQARVEATHAWLAGQRTLVAKALARRYDTAVTSAATSTRATDLRPLAIDKLAVAKCAADIAILVLTFTNPIAGFLIQAGVDGAFAVLEAATGENPTENAVSSGTNLALVGVVKGAEAAVTRSVAASLIVAAAGKKVAVATAAVGAAGYVGYQVWDKGVVEGTKATGSGMASLAKALVPTSCQKAYESIKSE